MSVGPGEWESAVLASMTRDQLIVFGKMHEAYGDMCRENARLKGLAAGAGMALVGTPGAADVMVAQDLIAQMLEES